MPGPILSTLYVLIVQSSQQPNQLRIVSCSVLQTEEPRHEQLYTPPTSPNRKP